jgi:hypothetical protein
MSIFSTDSRVFITSGRKKTIEEAAGHHPAARNDVVHLRRLFHGFRVE